MMERPHANAANAVESNTVVNKLITCDTACTHADRIDIYVEKVIPHGRQSASVPKKQPKFIVRDNSNSR